MKELSAVETSAVSGAGRIQDSLSGFFGKAFSETVKELNDRLNTGYDVDKAKECGQSFGDRLGRAWEEVMMGWVAGRGKLPSLKI